MPIVCISFAFLYFLLLLFCVLLVLSWIMDFTRPWINKLVLKCLCYGPERKIERIFSERIESKCALSRKNGSSFTDNMSRRFGYSEPLKFSFHCYHLLLKYICLKFSVSALLCNAQIIWWLKYVKFVFARARVCVCFFFIFVSSIVSWFDFK